MIVHKPSFPSPGKGIGTGAAVGRSGCIGGRKAERWKKGKKDRKVFSEGT